MKKLLISALLLTLGFSQMARADRFVTTINLKLYQVSNGKITATHQTKTALLALAGQAVAEDPRTLELVYDTVADAIVVVRKSDGSVVLPQLEFTGGVTLTSGTGTSEQRQAFVKFQGSSDVTGSVAGRITLTRNSDNSLKTFTWIGSVQLSEPSMGIVPDLVITGSFGTGKKFVPITH